MAKVEPVPFLVPLGGFDADSSRRAELGYLQDPSHTSGLDRTDIGVRRVERLLGALSSQITLFKPPRVEPRKRLRHDWPQYARRSGRAARPCRCGRRGYDAARRSGGPRETRRGAARCHPGRGMKTMAAAPKEPLSAPRGVQTRRRRGRRRPARPDRAFRRAAEWETRSAERLARPARERMTAPPWSDREAEEIMTPQLGKSGKLTRGVTVGGPCRRSARFDGSRRRPTYRHSASQRPRLASAAAS